MPRAAPGSTPGRWTTSRRASPASPRCWRATGSIAARDLLPVAPALHYAMGGIQTDLEGRASVPGLWAVGEVASTGVHGANRLASNSLLEGLVFADRAGRSVTAAAARRRPGRHAGAAPGAGERRHRRRRRRCEPIRQEMRELMTADVGVQRTEASLLHAEQALDAADPRDAGGRVAHPQPAPGRPAHHPGRPPPAREPGRPPPARLSAGRAQAGDRVTLSAAAPGHRTAGRDARGDRRAAGRDPDAGAGGGTRSSSPTTTSGPRCRTSPTSWATRSASRARRRRRRPR